MPPPRARTLPRRTALPTAWGCRAAAVGNLHFNGGKLQYTGPATSTNRLFNVHASGATLDASGTGAVNWTNTGALSVPADNNVNRTITLTGTNTDDNTFSPAFGNPSDATTGLSKTGIGTWILNGSGAGHSYSGATSVSGGILRLGNAAAMGSPTGALNVWGGTLDLGGFSVDRSGAVTFASAVGLTQNGTIVKSGAAYAGQSGAVGAVLAGDVGLTKSTTGVLSLTAANTYTGVTTLAATGGTLSVAVLADGGTASGVGQSTGDAANLLLGNGTTLQYTGAAASTNRGLTINGTAANHGATLDASGTGPINFTGTAPLAFGTADQTRVLTLAGTNAGDNALAAAIADNGFGATRIAKNGAGTWVLSGANSNTGATTVNAGTLRFAKKASLYNGDPLYWNSSNVTVASGATLALSVGGADEFSVDDAKTLLTNLTSFISDNGLRAGSTFALDTANSAGNVTFDQIITDASGTGAVRWGLPSSAAIRCSSTRTTPTPAIRRSAAARSRWTRPARCCWTSTTRPRISASSWAAVRSASTAR